MSNKYPQYFTASGLQRQKKRPSSAQETKPAAPEPKKSETVRGQISLTTSPAAKIDRKKRLQKQAESAKRSISPAAAKAIAEAIKSMLHSR